MSTQKHKNICPVPSPQIPLNEYLYLKTSILFNWPTKAILVFIMHLVTVFLSIVFLETSIYFIQSYLNNFSIKWTILFYDILFATLVIELILIRIYLGWLYILERLLSSIVLYEESGWYDGQFWIKPVDILMQDRLVGIYQVMPIVQKIKKIFFVNSFFSDLKYVI